MNKQSNAKKNSFCFNTKQSLEEAMLKRRKLSEASNSSNSSDITFSFANILNLNTANKECNIQNHSNSNGNTITNSNTNYQMPFNNQFLSSNQSSHFLTSPEMYFQDASMTQLSSMLNFTSPFLSLSAAQSMPSSSMMSLNKTIQSRDNIQKCLQSSLSSSEIKRIKADLIQQEQVNQISNLYPQNSDYNKYGSNNQNIKYFLGDIGLSQLFQDQDLDYYFPFGLPANNLSDLIRGNQNNEQCDKIILDALNRKLAYCPPPPNKKVEIVQNELQIEEIGKDEDIALDKRKQDRKVKVERYLEKKRSKNSKASIVKYVIRKDLADNRKRIQGRFVKQAGSRFKIDLNDKMSIDKVNDYLLLQQNYLRKQDISDQQTIPSKEKKKTISKQ